MAPEPVSQSPSIPRVPAVRRPIWFDILVLLALASLVYLMVQATETVVGPRRGKVVIDLSAWALPKYVGWSLFRSFVAFALSVIFTLVYGYIAAKFRRAEKFMIPLLDILQSVPVLGFMPSLMLTLIAVFPLSNFGLELASIVMIFTGQVWNMTFSFYHSLRSIPNELREASRIYGFGWWRTLWRLEVPYAMIPLVWNAKVSMAGGWFFLTVCEAFRLGDFDFRLPGIGSYMSQANLEGNTRAIVYGIIAMTLTIVFIDQLFWRPIIAWAQKFKVEETAGAEEPSSIVLDLLRESRLVEFLGAVGQRLSKMVRVQVQNRVTHRPMAQTSRKVWMSEKTRARMTTFAKIVGYALLGVVVIYLLITGLKIVDMISNLTLAQWFTIAWSSGLTLLRIIATLVLASLWAIPIGVLVGMKPKISRILKPVIQVLASFPAPMIYPLVLSVLAWFGISLQFGSIFLLMLGAQWYILFNATAGAVSIPHELSEVASIYRFSRVRVWRTLYLPAIFPSLITGWIVAAGGAWNASIVAEHVEFKGQTLVASGLGSMITTATMEKHFEILAAGVLVMVVLVVLFNRLIWEPMYTLARERFSARK
ncbi:MAG: ABC transporter permease subunit [Phycisphaerae bacterium]|nr:ABC transporter permease subunit [Phycisphaerae bacterium]